MFLIITIFFVLFIINNIALIILLICKTRKINILEDQTNCQEGYITYLQKQVKQLQSSIKLKNKLKK